VSKKELKKLIAQKKVIPFVGAGVSMSVLNKEGNNVFLSWKQLLEKFADKLEESGRDAQAMSVRASLPVKTNYLSIADDIKDFFPNEKFYYKALEEFFDIKNGDIDESSLELAKAIWSLKSKLIITTNYDKVLHWASPNIADTKYWDIQSNFEQASSLRNGITTNTVWHIHGHVDNKKDIILTTESYNKLYNESAESEFKTAISTLQNYLAQKSFLFIGYSLDDKFFVTELEKICNLFDNSSSEHYILLKYGKVLPESLEDKIIPIYFSDNGQPLIDLILELGEDAQTINTDENSIEENLYSNNDDANIESIKVCIYTASPLNEKIDYNFGKIKNRFMKYNVELEHKILTDDALMDSYDYDDVFIFTKSNQDKIIIEDEFCVKKSITIEDLEETINVGNTYLFLDKNIENKHYTIIVSEPRQVIKSLNSLLHTKYDNNKGKCRCHSIESELPHSIDKKNLVNFIGRNTDLQNIIRKTLTVRQENQILTIKGSGGIGKTTIISKVAVELAERGKFKDGIKFVQCEYLTDYDSFESKIAVAFDMNSAMNFEIQLKEQDLDEDRLIILDNIETLLHIEDREKIKNLIKVVSDYATIVITTREILNEGYEDIYELFKLTTDEAEELFTKLYKLKNYDKSLLRIEILENFLDNNPLAIKIVTKNLPKSKSLVFLKKELEESFFDITSNDIEEIFDKESDINIERTKSLFHSINYSYQKLRDKEKLALETLSLFPDGLHMENFKKFYNQNMKNDRDNKKKIKHKIENFSDRDIKSLEDKSLIIISGQFIGLQSIVGRFANYKFNQRTDDEKKVFYERAYEYNMFLLRYLTYDQKYINSFYKKIFDENKNNFFKSLEYIEHLEFNEDMFDYLDNIVLQSIFINVFKKKEIEKLKHLENIYKKDVTVYNFLKAIVLYIDYYNGNFNNSFTNIKEQYPIKNLLMNYEVQDTLDRFIFTKIETIYAMEGCSYELLAFKMLYYPTQINLSDLFELGIFNLGNKYIKGEFYSNKNDDFFYFEFLLAINKLDIDILKKHIALLHKTQHLERVEALYTLMKADSKLVKLKDIKKLIVVNPFVNGLKLLMLAMKENKNKSKKMYELAIEQLFHIKYYYVEAILIYVIYLNENNDETFKEWLEKGLKLSQKYHYRYLQHRFISLKDNSNTPYDEENYPLPDELDYSKFMQEYKLGIK